MLLSPEFGALRCPFICVQGPCISLFSSAAVSFHLVGSTDLGRRFCHVSHPPVSQHGPQSHSPTTYGTSLPTSPTWPTAFPTRASSPTGRPPASFPRISSSSFATWALAYGTGPPHRHAIAPRLGVHARACQNYLSPHYPRTVSGNTREPGKSHRAGILRHWPCRSECSHVGLAPHMSVPSLSCQLLPCRSVCSPVWFAPQPSFLLGRSHAVSSPYRPSRLPLHLCFSLPEQKPSALRQPD